MMLISDLSDVGARARRRVALRLLPFVFLMYVVNYIDRVNVSFANLRMSADLGFSDPPPFTSQATTRSPWWSNHVAWKGRFHYTTGDLHLTDNIIGQQDRQP